MNRLFVDLKEDCHGHITGTVKFPADSTFVLEALQILLQEFSKSCEVPPEDVAEDLRRLILKGKK